MDVTKDAFSQTRTRLARSTLVRTGILLSRTGSQLMLILFKRRREETGKDASHKLQTPPAGHRIPDECDQIG